MKRVTESPEQTREWGRRLAPYLFPGAVIALDGGLGGGKTVFVQGLAQGLGIRDAVNSPTFVLIREYPRGRLPLYHVDAYRLECALELEFLGLQELLDQGGVTAVEWAGRLEAILPAERLEVRFEQAGSRHPDRRVLHFCARGQRYQQILKELNHGADAGS